MGRAANEDGMVGLKQRRNIATDSATGPMTEVTTPEPTGAWKAVGGPPLLPESGRGSPDWTQPRPAPDIARGAMAMTDDDNSGQRLDIGNYHLDRVERFDGLRQGRWGGPWRNWLAGKQYWLVIVLVSGFVVLVALELFTNIDLGFVPNDPHQEELTP